MRRTIIDPANFERVTYSPHRPRKHRSAIKALRRRLDEEQQRQRQRERCTARPWRGPDAKARIAEACRTLNRSAEATVADPSKQRRR